MLISEKFLLKLRTTTEREWRAGLPELAENEIQAFLNRKNRALAIIDRAERELGASLYPSGRFSGLDRLRWREGRAALRHYDSRSPKMETRIHRASELIDREDIFGRPLEPGEVREVEETLKLIRLDR